jgi:nucleotide-binding universal stress UspA family protein
MRVLLASDGSADSRRATRWLRDAPLPSDAKVAVVTVATLTKPPRDAQTMSELRDSVIAKARQAGERTAKILRQRWPDVETIVALGDPRVEIVHAAEQTLADMIALGARGFGRLKRVFVGSISLAVARYAPCPVAIVRGRPRQIRRILVAVDGSEGSRTALRFLSISGLARDAEVSLLRVLPKYVRSGLHGPGTRFSDRLPAEDRRKQRGDADVLLADAATLFAEAGRPVPRLVGEGDAAREIVKTAHGRDSDLVVLGARGFGTLGRLLLGSVSETVLHHVDRPVVIVRERVDTVR